MGKDGQSVFARCDLQQELDMNKKETACLQVDQRQTQTQTYLRIAQLSIFDGLKIEGCQLKKMRVWALSVKHWKSHNLSQLDADADLLPISCTDE